jgi:16S rRNA (guanine527-N7)-methyltransferase
MKGPNYEEELEQSRKAISVLGGTIDKIENRYVSEELERSLIIIKKVKETPKQYPRGQGKPLKTPIK